ncbi:MAG: retroviral-like aspartic protease [Candidatus Andersenbacteria bacterium]|nr:retroviral-like aspartic protease [Candidatus Andersenbacteria bacterium]
MRYRYQHVRRGANIRHLPLVPVTLHGRTDSVEVLALVDSGAEENVFQEQIADDLQIAVDSGQEVIITGYDGSEGRAWRVMVDMQLGQHTWQSPVVFSSAIGRRGLLGGSGFFAFFTVTFRYRKREMEITRTRR